jgi:hypothetical protein
MLLVVRAWSDSNPNAYLQPFSSRSRVGWLTGNGFAVLSLSVILILF